jgi:hypothetical protein
LGAEDENLIFSHYSHFLPFIAILRPSRLYSHIQLLTFFVMRFFNCVFMHAA